MARKPTYEELEQRVKDLEQAVSERERIEEALLEGQTRFQLLYERAPLGSQSLDEDGNFIEVNPAWLDMLGYSREEVIGKFFGDFLHPDWADHFKKNFSRFKAVGEVLGVEFEMVKKDGSNILVSFNGKIGKNEKGNFQQTHCILHDISEQRKAEESLQESEKRYRALYNDTPAMLHSVDNNGKLLSVSNFWLAKLGYERHEVIGRKSIEFLTEESQRYAKEEVLPQFIKTGYCTDVPYQFETKNGEVIDVLFSAISEKHNKDEVSHSMAVLIDVTDQKKAETALLESDNKFRSFTEQSFVGIYLIQDSVFKYVNPKFAEIFGYTVEECLDNMYFSKLVFPEDLATVEEQLRRRISGEVRHVQYPFRGVKKNGKIIYVEIFGSAMPYKGKTVAI